ncbi:tRNA pseudouridine(65) synthase TruC [Sulfurovum mangrovi]|uniref:tRNA pseudouridine(65) synthase TruC n=1 Tax=Sulfurovum mangrovi TaxID=2893889 RepID=UPI001E4592A9|nr:tRNA pseudouridine(65) synthase TruC [Sulfurovum mangrovi]UFH59577.1 tRNA pseudouridine(65) synthase TruC [Sulfurovum mangrovi]UFH60717.1 tRNA pseudouridine(65) synthase TruC [Sulfurovum mangrovi]
MSEASEKEALEVLYQDRFLIVLNKPSGLLVHKSPIDRNETRFALQIVRDQIGRYVYPVHRLDKPTSGVLLFALDQEVAKVLSDMFRNGEIVKEYIAVVRGYSEEEGMIDHPLKQMLDTKAQKAQGITKEAQEAQTYYRRLATIELPYPVSRYPVARYSLVRLQPKTGRKHQLRRHMKHIFHPIVGDTKHGRGEHNKLFREKFDVHRLLLHADFISFEHPVTKEKLEISAPLDETYRKLFDAFAWDTTL